MDPYNDDNFITAEAPKLLTYLTGNLAENYYHTHVCLPALTSVGQKAEDISKCPVLIAEALQEPGGCIRALLHHYAFAKRGKDRKTLSDTALKAYLCAVQKTGADIPGGDAIWSEFESLCQETSFKANPDLNRSIIIGITDFARELFDETEESLFQYLVRNIQEIRDLSGLFNEIVTIRGIGPKVTCLILRDFTYLAGLDEFLHPKSLIYVQPIDRWTRALAPLILDDPRAPEMADWILAGKLSKAARLCGVSPIRFNFGSTALGIQYCFDPEPEAKVREHLIRQLPLLAAPQ